MLLNRLCLIKTNFSCLSKWWTTRKSNTTSAVEMNIYFTLHYKKGTLWHTCSKDRRSLSLLFKVLLYLNCYKYPFNIHEGLRATHIMAIVNIGAAVKREKWFFVDIFCWYCDYLSFSVTFYFICLRFSISEKSAYKVKQQGIKNLVCVSLKI